jgi:hypothetical protein
MSEQPMPRLNPDALKNERHDADLGTEAENEGHDLIGREPGRAPEDAKDDVVPTGATPPAR